jgi:hypothetical protein
LLFSARIHLILVFFICFPLLVTVCCTRSCFERMSSAQVPLSADEAWYVFVPSRATPPQLYRSAPTVWPLSAEALSTIETQAQSGNTSAINNLGAFNRHACNRRRFVTEFALSL